MLSSSFNEEDDLQSRLKLKLFFLQVIILILNEVSRIMTFVSSVYVCVCDMGGVLYVEK